MDIRFRLCAFTFVGMLLTLHSTLLAQSVPDTAYALNLQCFDLSIPQQNGFVAMLPKIPLPAGCPPAGASPFTVVSTKAATDKQLTDLDKEINDLTTKATNAIAASVANNSVKSGEIDALIKAIEDRLYENILRRVKADLAKTQPAIPTKPPKATR